MTATRRPTTFAVLAALIVILALALRLWDLDRRGLCHPENYVPGLLMPAWVNLPPPRTDFASLLKSILKDAHPPLYYLAMFPWVKLFGTSEFALRLPSALLGAASVLLLWRIALREVGRVAALVAAALLALHGAHIYWSQTARMYAAATFFCLLSTLFLWKVMEDGRHPAWGRRFRIAYALSTIAALWTQIYCWPVLLAQIAWSTLRSIREKRAPIALASQFVAVILSMPVIALTVYQWRPNVCADPRLEFFELGYLFWSGAFFFGRPPATPISHAVLLAFGIIATGLGLLARPEPELLASAPAEGPVARQVRWWLLATGAFVSAALGWAAQHAFHVGTRQFTLAMAVAALPILVAGVFPIAYAWSARLASQDRGLIPSLAARVQRMSPILAILPVTCMMAAGSVRDVFVARGAVIYVPYLLLVAAAGRIPPGRFKWAAVPGAALLLSLHALSVPYSLGSEHSPRDYKGFAAALSARLEPGDLILITNLYSDPPLLYYFPDRLAQFVAADYEAALRTKSGRRAWVVLYEDQEMNEGMRAAVAGWRKGEPATAAGSRALLFLR